MPLDANIIMAGKQPDIQSPMDAMSKVMTFKDLANKTQMQGLQMQGAQREYDDQSAMRNALAKNTSVDPNGGVAVNRLGVMSDLAQNAPHLVPQAQQQFATQDVNKIKAGMDRIDANVQLLHGVTDENSYQQVKQQALAMGSDPNQWTEHYDPQHIQAMMGQALNHKDFLANKIAQQDANTKSTHETNENAYHNKEIGVKQQEVGVKRDEIRQKMAEFGFNKNEGAFNNLMSHAESSRQLPDVKQAYTDRYNAQKVLDLVGNGDMNKISPNMVTLVSSEVGKIATGGVPTEEALKTISPHDAGMIMARTKQYFSNKPEAGQQAAFLQAYKDYATTLQGGANKVIQENLGRLGDSYKEHLRPTDYDKFRKTYIEGNGADNAIAKGQGNSENRNTVSAASHPQSSVAVQWARSNPNDPRASAILQANGISMSAGK